MPIGPAFLKGRYTTDCSALMSMALLSTLPMVLVFAVFQCHLVEGIATTGLEQPAGGGAGRPDRMRGWTEPSPAPSPTGGTPWPHPSPTPPCGG